MKNIARLFSCIVFIGAMFCSFAQEHDASCVFHVQNSQAKALPFVVCGIGDSSKENLKKLIDQLAHCLAFSGQFIVDTAMRTHKPKNKSSVKEYAKNGSIFVLFAQVNDSDAQDVSWWLYDAQDGSLIKAQHCVQNSAGAGDIANCIAATIWPILVNVKAPFVSSIAYIQKDFASALKTHVTRSSLCVCDFDGKNIQTLTSIPSILVAPSWAGSAAYPYLFYSEFTASNVRVKAADMSGRTKRIFDADGTSVGVCPTPSGDVVYCRSGVIWRCHFDRRTKKSTHTIVIKRPSPCASPVVCENGDIIYCYRSGIWRYDVANNKHVRLTERRGCVGPAYAPIAKKVAYACRINGVMQIFVYDCAHKTHSQLTHGVGDKTDPSWSADEQYIAYTYTKPRSSAVAVLHVASGTTHIISPPGLWCESPVWSYPRVTFA